MTDLERNKANVVAFYEMMFNACRPGEAVQRFVGSEYIQHNRMSQTARQASSTILSGWNASGRESAWRCET